MITFWAIAGIMLVAAGALLLAPLLRGAGADATHAKKLAALQAALDAGVLSRAEYDAKKKALAGAATKGPQPAKAPLALVAALALLLPMGAIVLYRVVGEPGAIDGVPRQATSAGGGGMPTDASGAPDMEKAVAGLAEKMKANPDDPDGWLLLGRAYRTMNRFGDARDAFASALRLKPDDVDAKVEYAEVLALSGKEPLIAGEARELIEAALKAQPDHQRALWLLGISEVQHERYAEGVAAWEKLLPQLPADAPIRATVIEQITEARSRAGLPPLDAALAGASAPPAAPAPAAAPTAPAPAPAPAEAPAAADGTQLTVEVEIAPELKARLAPSDVLFVFARAPVGPKMPLAIQRLPASSLPLTVTLTDGMGMMPSMNLSSVPEVVVGARVSKSGNAAPQSGDFEVISAPISTKAPRGTVKLVIASVVP